MIHGNRSPDRFLETAVPGDSGKPVFRVAPEPEFPGDTRNAYSCGTSGTRSSV